MMSATHLLWIQMFSYIVLFFFLFIAIYFAMHFLPRATPRWRKLQWIHLYQTPKHPNRLMQLFWIQPAKLKVREQQLRAAGIQVNAVWYEIGRRAVLAILTTLLTTIYIIDKSFMAWNANQMTILSICVLTGVIIVISDRVFLEMIKKYRNEMIIKEIYDISNQLLYYSGTRMNLHHKLTRCLPYTRMIRRQMEVLLNEWYHDPEIALDQFKHKLGSDEVYSFTETLRSLRLNESDSFYHLLRERIQDYKGKIELTKESKKETVSYVLFVIAGLPILNTFRVFIYPWVMESQKLFQTLN